MTVQHPPVDFFVSGGACTDVRHFGPTSSYTMAGLTLAMSVYLCTWLPPLKLKLNVGSTAGSELECALPTLLLGIHITISQWPAETSQSVSSLVCRLTK